jgi:hypothetical protein
MQVLIFLCKSAAATVCEQQWLKRAVLSMKMSSISPGHADKVGKPLLAT